MTRGDWTDVVTIRRAGLVAGVTLLIMAISAPFAEFYAMPRLLVEGSPAETVANLTARRGMLLAGLFGYLITYAGDVLLAWALCVFLAPVDRNLSVLTAWFRLVYAAIAVVALLNLLTVWELTGGAEYLAAFEPDQLATRVMLALDAFGNEWALGVVFFAVHLGLLGYLALRAAYVPRPIGILLIVAGAGYLVDSHLKPLLFPTADTGFLIVTYFGELVFMSWLLWKGWRVELPSARAGRDAGDEGV